MPNKSRCRSFQALLTAFLWMLSHAAGQDGVPSPLEELGFSLGDDYHLANYRQLVSYWQELEATSDRMRLVQIGETAEGRPMWMAIITSPANHAKLNRYREISRLLALAQVDESQARELAQEGRAIVWIDGGLHATETLGAQQLMELVYQMVSRTDRETVRFLDDVILLAVCTNPDGLDLVADWYMREPEPSKRTIRGLPRLYHKYVGHDNNRDFYMSSQSETLAINRVLYREWFPQIVYNHHQTGPSGTVLFAPPFSDPFNHNIDPLVITTLNLVGAAMHTRFAAEGKSGATMRGGAKYSTWWNGGLRTTPYFHNMIGLLTETIGNPTPIKIPFRPKRQLATGDLPFPIEPQPWHFRQSVEYSITANRAVLDVASRHREQFLYNIYRMGKNSIEEGSRDTWTNRPGAIEAARSALGDDPESNQEPPASGTEEEVFGKFLRDPEARDPRGYILSSHQSDFLTAVKFANVLIKNGIQWQQAASDFRVGNRGYPAGSLIVKTAQAFRPHIIDMFEPQDHPNDVLYPGGPPIAPYDSAGWTLALQMGIEFDRILDPFDGPFEEVDDLLPAPVGRVEGSRDAAGFLLNHELNDSFRAVNRLLASKREVYWLQAGLQPGDHDFFVLNQPGLASEMEDLAREIGVSFEAHDLLPGVSDLRLKQPRIGLWDRFGGSMDSGWMRWIFEQWEFPFRLVFPQELDAGNLGSEFDVLVFVDGGIPDPDRLKKRQRRSPKPEEVPAEFHDRLGEVTLKKTIPQLRRFLEQGGTVLTIGSSTALAQHLGLPVLDALVETSEGEEDKPLPREKFYLPGSILRMQLANQHPLAHGMKPAVDVFFDNSPVFLLAPQALGQGVEVVGWFSSDRPLRSGWAWGQHYLRDTIAVMEWSVGRGKLLMYGPEVAFRSQPHGTYKLVFNGIHYGAAETVELPVAE